MKRISGIIVLILLIGAIIFGLGYKMASPDGWDRFVGTITGTEPTPTPTPSPSPSRKPVQPSPAPAKPSKDKDDKPKASPSPSISPSPSPSATPPAEKTEYEKYSEMSGAEQQKVFESFENPQDFFDWYNNAKAEYDAQNDSIVIEGGSINLEDYIKDNSNS